ncbi:hypothetical protein J2T55_002458 [Methylohalomonas lacus]|uniref:Uncharacterized protein n=1 Tax=Methylohalomonas lacus TaxID=398773 RepID=A0AAE3L612_9GAMM|nr:hypothetical protein [Methylohalomonas lacus]MCS3904422.1 hypothetical protein [Methylohalomonas lacus]
MSTRLIYCPLMILLLTLAGTLQAREDDYFGRLFTSPEQRDRIDTIRYATEPEPEEIAVIEPEPEPEQQEIPPNISLRGMIRGGDGEPVYWINDSNSMQADFMQDSITVLPGNEGSREILIRLPDDRIIPLQVGESYIPDSEKTPQTELQRVETRNR